jgi:hypothetical protein
MKRHPLSAAFPSMPDQDLAELIDDIQTFGQRESGVVLDGMVLDGWHRYQACQRLGVEFNYVDFEYEYPDTDPVAFVMSRNAFRRQMTSSQRAAAIVACSNWRSSGRTEDSAPRAAVANDNNPAPGAALTNADMAKAAGVGQRTIRQAKAAERVGLGDAVRDGTISAKQGAQVAAMPDAQREAIVASGAAQMRAVIAAAQKEVKAPAKVALPSPLEIAISERDDAREQLSDLAQTARDLELQVDAYRAGETGDGEKKLLEANQRIAKLEAECRRLESIRDDWMNKHAEALKEIKKLQRRLERGHG